MRILIILSVTLLSISCINSNQNKVKGNLENNDTINSKANVDNSEIKKVVAKRDKDLLPFYVYSDTAIILKALKIGADTLNITKYGDTLNYKGTFGHCYLLPESADFEKKRWYKVKLDNDSSGWIKEEDVAITRKLIYSNKFQAILKSHCGDGFEHWIW